MHRDDLENASDRNQAIAASLATVLQKNFNLKSPLATIQMERCPTFVAKEKSIKPKFLSKNKKVFCSHTHTRTHSDCDHDSMFYYYYFL